MTATQLIYDACRDLGVLRPGQVNSPDTNADGLRRLNRMIDSWLLDRFLIFSIGAALYNLVAGREQYSIGPGATDFNTTRPTEISEANILVVGSVVTPVRLPIRIATSEGEWAAIRLRAQNPAGTAPVSGIPRLLYDDLAYPISTINVWPAPFSSAYQLELFTTSQLQSFANLTTDYTFPPGYAEMLEWNLADVLAPSMKVYFKIPDPLLDEVRAKAAQTKAEVQRYNAPMSILPADPAYQQGRGTGRGGWDYLSDSWGRGR